jgi:hypothetical protein
MEIQTPQKNFSQFKKFTSMELNCQIDYCDIPDLTDDELYKVYYELLRLYASLKERIMKYDIVDPSEYRIGSYIGAHSKIILVKQFLSEVRREQELRYQSKYNLTPDDISKLAVERKESVQLQKDKKFIKKFIKILRKKYGDEIDELIDMVRMRCEASTP